LRVVFRDLSLEGFRKLKFSSKSSASSESDNESQLEEDIDIMAAPTVILVVMRPSDEADRPYSLMPFPVFHGRMGDDPDSHVYQFLTCCNANNARIEAHFLSIFPSTLHNQANN